MKLFFGTKIEFEDAIDLQKFSSSNFWQYCKNFL